MATVRFSKELIDRIVKQAEAKMMPPVNKARDQKPDNSWGQRIYDILFLEAKPIISQVPAEWLKTAENIKINSVGGAPCGMTFTFATPQPWPQKFVETELAKKEQSWSDGIDLKDHLVWGEFYAEVTAYRRRVVEASKRRDEFVDAVKKICNTYSTLAPALKAWPPLWELVPEDVKDKHREIKEREIDEVKRREWLRALRRFKYGIKVRAKLGVLQTICEQVAAQRKGKQVWDAPSWEHDRWITFLYTCIRDNQFPPELLEAFVKTAEVTFMTTHKQPKVEKVLDAVNEVCKQNSRALRHKFGVFV